MLRKLFGMGKKPDPVELEDVRPEPLPGYWRRETPGVKPKVTTSSVARQFDRRMRQEEEAKRRVIVGLLRNLDKKK